MKPRLGAAALVRAISGPKSPPTAPTLSASNTETHPVEERDSRRRRRARRRHHSERDQSVNEDTDAPLDKRRRVTIEEVPDPDAPHSAIEHPHQPANTRPDPPNPPTTGFRRYMGLYVEEFPDPLAGAPISDELVPPPDLAAYMRSVGPMADPEHFEAAEILMTSGLTDADKDRHLKSKKVSVALNAS